MSKFSKGVFAASVALASLSMMVKAAEPNGFGNVDQARLDNAIAEPGQWFTGGRDGQGSYFSPLTQINADNVGKLGFAWEFKTGTYRGLEATPIVIDGIMYTSGNGGSVYALDAVTGKQLWFYDPENDGQAMRNACCDIVNRGVAVRNGKVFVASLDGRMIALDAKTGAVKWSVDTIVDHKLPYVITGAPQITRDAVVIGNAGADMGKWGVRGYVTAYDLETGKQKWRFFTVPEKGKADQPSELLAAEKTWDPNRSDHVLGGGTVWDGMAYDPKLDLVYIGVGNSSPYQKWDRSPAGGDNLYISSIVAINAQTGRMVWHFQTTPGDNWDYTATQKMILADLTIDGKVRKTLMQAPKNGFFYVLDRETGKPISAQNYVYINWADGLDKDFRPRVTANADYQKSPKLVFPSWSGGHDWQPMSYNPKTGLVYIPVHEAPNLIINLPDNPGSTAKYVDGYFKLGMVIPDKDYRKEDVEDAFGKVPDLKDMKDGDRAMTPKSVLRAYDPVKQKVVWDQVTTNDYFVFDGGAMSTASNLVFEGISNGEFRAYNATTGKILKSIDTGSAMMAAPMTYTVKGVQYVAVMAGLGGSTMGSVFAPSTAPAKYMNEGRILVFKLGGGETPKPEKRDTPPFPVPQKQNVPVALIDRGKALYVQNCSRCHQFGVGMVPDLRRMSDGIDDINTFRDILLKGILSPAGMGRFDDKLDEADVNALHAYLKDEGHKAYEVEQAQKARKS